MARVHQRGRLSIETSSHPLASWFEGGFAGKRIVVWGNSTVANAREFFLRLASYATPGGPLDGLTVSPVVMGAGTRFWRRRQIRRIGNIYNYGNSGAWLRDLIDGKGPYPLGAVCEAKPDLLIMRGPLINDVRTGLTTLEDAKHLLKIAINRIRDSSPATAILLLTENSLLTSDVGRPFWRRRLLSVQPSGAAQRYTDILHDAVMSVEGRYPNVCVFDLMEHEYGTTCVPASQLMEDQIHPNAKGMQREADLLVQIIGNFSNEHYSL